MSENAGALDDEKDDTTGITDAEIDAYIEVLSQVDEGALFTKKRGKSGETPAQDLLPYFKSQQRYFYLLTDDEDADSWRIIYSAENLNNNIYKRGKHFNNATN